MIRVLALDIDGVLTDGRVTFDEAGGELKTVSYLDIDAVFRAHSEGLLVALVTGEETPWVDMIARRLQVTHVYRGAKDKRRALRALGADLGVPLDEICFVGDSLRDAEAFPVVGLSLAPADAAPGARAGARRVLDHDGGRGAVADAVELVVRMNLAPAEDPV